MTQRPDRKPKRRENDNKPKEKATKAKSPKPTTTPQKATKEQSPKHTTTPKKQKTKGKACKSKSEDTATPEKVAQPNKNKTSAYEPGQLSNQARKSFLEQAVNEGISKDEALKMWDDWRSELISKMSDSEKRRRRFLPTLKSMSV